MRARVEHRPMDCFRAQRNDSNDVRPITTDDGDRSPAFATGNSSRMRLLKHLVFPAAALSAITLTAGCAHFHPQPLSAEKSATELEGRSLTNAAVKNFLEKNLHREFADWPTGKWDFDSLTLAAFYYHPDLAVARA